MDTPTHYTLTRIQHPTHRPELLETYIDSPSGELFTGAYLKHAIGDSELVSARVAKIVMSDAGLKQHYTCEPPLPSEAPTTTDEPMQELGTEVAAKE